MGKPIMKVWDSAQQKYVSIPAVKGGKGDAGTTPHIGANGNWYLGETDTGLPSRGATGPQGAQGAKGDKGDKGDTGPQGPAGVGDDTPDYVLTAADALAKKVVNHIGSDNIVFAVMADAHLGYYTDTENAAGKQAGQALKRLNERCALDFVAHCGDYTTGAWNTNVEATLQDNADYQLLIGSQYPGKAVWVVGNHDDAPYQATASRMTQTQVYATISRKNLASGGVVPNNACYGYTDFPGMRLRVIYLDTHDRRSWGSAQVSTGATCDFLNVENISAAQLQWLADHALDFSGVDDPSKWSILIFSHAVLSTSGTYTDPSGTAHPCNTANAAKLLKAYATKKSGSITHGGAAVNYNFTAVTPAGIIGCIHGHEHRYANETVGGAFLSICCPNILNGRERVSADGNTYTKTAGTANGTSFCVFSINRADKKIYVDHYGPGVDRVFDYTVIDPSAPSYTNLLPSATDTDGSIYNGVGYASGQRLNSSGAAEGYNGSYLTGFIPVKMGDVVHLKNVKWQNGVTTGLNSGNQRVSFYSADKAHLGQTNAIGLGGTLSGVKDANGIWTQFTVKNFSGVTLDNAAYFRLNCAEISGDSIITINEEIT
nr:MAG TPA: Acid sphingomyelinase-like phosphodiesterase 3a [Bacteriophage sp.]